MSGSTSDNTNLLRNWTHPVYHIALPGAFNAPSPSLLTQVPQTRDAPAELPGASIFAGMSPEQAFWFQHLMGQGVGQGAPPGQVNPYYLMMMMQGPQGAIYPPQEEQEQGG